MDSHIKQYYCQSPDDSPSGHFHKVIALHESPHLDWESVSKIIPNLPKGWFELSRLKIQDRIEFTRDFWLTKLPYHPKFPDFLMNFFAKMDYIGIYVVQQKFDDPFEGHLVYSLKGDTSFFRGCIPATEEQSLNLKKVFPEYILPIDFIDFLQIHNGFSKTTDCTGITKSTHIEENYQKFQAMLAQLYPITTTKGLPVNPSTLIPFYESFGMPFYQCFWAEWYPENEMGNVYYSGFSNTISDVQASGDLSSENMAFPTFTDWLMFYLEQIE